MSAGIGVKQKQTNAMRYNIFFRTHQGLRALLYETALQVQRTDFSQPAEAAATLETLSEMMLIFEQHAASEDAWIFPALEAFDPAVLDALKQEHGKDRLLAGLMRESLKLYGGAESPEEKMEVGNTIQQAFDRFLQFSLAHMDREEDLLNPLFWQYYSDQEMEQMAACIDEATADEWLQLLNRCIIRGLNQTHLLYWMKQMSNTATAAELQVIIRLAETNLPAARHRRLLEGLQDASRVE